MLVGAASQASTAEAWPVFPGSCEASQAIVRLGGSVRLGACVSLTVIVWVPFDAFPDMSVAVHVRVIVRTVGQAPPLTTESE